MNHTPTFTRLFKYILASIPTEVIQLTTKEALDECLTQALEQNLAWCTSMDFADTFAQGCPVPNMTPQDYLQRLIDVDGALVLTGIRFKGGDTNWPFVDVLATTTTEPSATNHALEIVWENYRAFQPRALRILGHVQTNPDCPSSWHTDVDQFILAGRTAQMSPAHNVVGVRLETVDDLAQATDFVHHAYEETFALNPSLIDVLSVATGDDLAICQTTGHLVWLLNDANERMGLIATYTQAGPLLSGQSIMEEIVLPKYRGQGFAAKSQQLLAKQMEDNDNPQLIWGTIDSTNRASIKTACRAGRQKVAAWYWLYPD